MLRNKDQVWIFLINVNFNSTKNFGQKQKKMPKLETLVCKSQKLIFCLLFLRLTDDNQNLNVDM